MARKRLYGQACTFCARRKIKCNGLYPCDSCTQRGRGSSCEAQPTTVSDDAATSNARRSVGFRTNEMQQPRRQKDCGQVFGVTSDTLAGRTAPPTRSGGTTESPGPAFEQSPSGLGSNSMPFFVDHAAPSSGIDHAQGTRSILGLQNASGQYPFMIAGDGGKQPPPGVPFSHAQVLKYTQVYESVVSPLFPLVPRYQDLDELIMTYLERSANLEAGRDKADVQQVDHGSTSLLCAILACGAQMSEDRPVERIERSRFFAQHAFHFARLANFLLRPVLSTVRAMLLLSFFLQNDGQADAAWSLLGTVSRLGMSLGLHKSGCRSAATLDTEDHDETWLTIKWQDCLLTTCFDRIALASPHNAGLEGLLNEGSTSEQYMSLMIGLIQLSNRWLSESEASRSSPSTVSRYVDSLDLIDVDHIDLARVSSTRPSRRARIERLILNLYGGYLRSVICRPALNMTSSLNNAQSARTISDGAIAGTIRTMHAFVELSKLTKLPLRTWSMVHAGLSSAIMVEFLEPESGPSLLRHAQIAFLDLLSRENQDTAPEREANSPSWLSSSHSSYLRALQDSLRKRRHSAMGTMFRGRDTTNVSQPTTHGEEEGTNNVMYAHAMKNIESINNAGDISIDPNDFDWSLTFLDDNTIAESDAFISSLCF